MKPNFALDLTHDGISLLHRGKGGWLLVDEIRLDDPELTARLGVMRQRAVDLESGGFTSQLIIPASQILFTTMTAPGPDDVTREARIREGLVGLTPYAVEDLVFDWQPDGDMAYVAVIARETLAEAEAFALDNRLNPICFSARPHGNFGREAYFGVTSCAGQFLRKGSKIAPDKRPIPELMGTGVALPDVPVLADPVSAPSLPEKSAPNDAGQTTEAGMLETPDIPKPDLDQKVTPSAAPSATSDGAKPAKLGGSTKGPNTPPVPKGVQDAPALAPFPPCFEPKEDGKRRDPVLPTQPPITIPPNAPAPSPAPQNTPISQSVPISQSALAPQAATAGDTARKVPASQAKAKLEGAEKPHPTPTGPPKPAPDVAPSFSTRRSTDPQPDTDPNAAAASQRIEPRILVAPPSSGRDVGRPAHPQKQAHVPVNAPTVVGNDEKASTRAPKKRTADAAKRKLKDAARKGLSGGLAGATGAVTAASALASRTAKALPKRNKAEVSETPIARADDAMSVAGPVPDTLPHATLTPRNNSRTRNRKDAGSSPTAKEAEALTIFGARAQQDVGGKPKFLALFLVLGLLLLMAVVAVWSMFFLSEQSTGLFPDREDQFESAITTAPNNQTGDRVARAPDIDPAEADQFSEFDPDAPLEGDAGLSNVDPDTDPALAEVQDPAVISEPLSPEAAETKYAATGIWERAPDPLADPEAGRIDGLYVASIDPKTTGQDAVALPSDQLAAFENKPADILAPPPSGTRFDLDERGLVRATPEGSLTPEGVLVIAGRPSLVPAERPGGTDPEATDQPEAEPESTLPRIRPRSRPEGLIESNERELFGGRSRSELAALRPAPRPQSITALTEQAAAISDAISDAAIDDAAAAAAAAVTAPTQLAVARSPEPRSRPKGFQKLVEAARASDASDGSVVVAAAPRNQTVTPKIPTRASVAKQATIKNAIPLRKVSLIGIYGSASKRRALVRLKSGRYVKVGVGDRLDGGKVVSISASKLVYQKGSRSNTLQILPFS